MKQQPSLKQKLRYILILTIIVVGMMAPIVWLFLLALTMKDENTKDYHGDSTNNGGSDIL